MARLNDLKTSTGSRIVTSIKYKRKNIKVKVSMYRPGQTVHFPGERGA
jgi:hypothetical protein